MFKPQTRSSDPPVHRGAVSFADTQFLHDCADEDYSGFAPTEMFEDAAEAPLPPVAGPTPAAASSQSALARVAATPAAVAATVGEPVPAPQPPATAPAAWATSQWVAAQETRAHEAAHHARTLIAAQRRSEPGTLAPALVASERGGLARLLRGLLPLFIGVTVTMALISAVLPLLDKL